MKTRPTKQFATWNDDNEDCEYYEHFDTKEDAHSNSDDEIIEIFEVTYKSLGHFKYKSTAIKLNKSELKKHLKEQNAEGSK
jgi:hypothetical protein